MAGEVLGVLAFSMLLAALVEGMMEVLVVPLLNTVLKAFGVPEKHPTRGVVSAVLPFLAVAVGVCLALATQANLVGYAAAKFGIGIDPIISKVLSGIVIGRGSSYVHDIWAKIEFPMKKPT